MISNTNIAETKIRETSQSSMSYGDYLYLDQILSSQHRLSNHHDEMLFIIIHQSSELWMKLILHELTPAINEIKNDNIKSSLKKLSRVAKIQDQLIHSWDVLSTLTPSEYIEFREELGKASGFQSYQNRLIEFALGSKNQHTLFVYEHQKELYRELQKAMGEPSIYDASIQALVNAGFNIDKEVLDRDLSQKYQANASVEEAWLCVYENTNQYWDLYELAEKLMDISNKHQLWRFKHMNTVERIIGNKVGTGGSSGVNYLKKSLDENLFPELWSLRTII
ncbi:tryptophan 2,3-dioxygenase [Peribacillus muralis]|uniref:tryptophan 2,3-dioxygenase n=1 Tax=Peribacillus muralis TaxID=264697 RepID=UPI003D04FB03